MYKLTLAIRYMLKRPISYLALIAVVLCVFIVVVVMTVMNGLVSQYKLKNHKLVGDCVIYSESLVGFPYYIDLISELEKTNFIEATSPVIKSYCLVNRTGLDNYLSLEMIGLDPVKHSRVTGFADTLYHNKSHPENAFKPVYDPNLPGFVISIDRWLYRDQSGQYSTEPFAYRASVMVTSFPLTSAGTLTKAGAGEASSMTLYYSDNSRTGIARVDNSTLYLPFEHAQKLCGMADGEKRTNAIYIKFRPGFNLDTCRDRTAVVFEKFKSEKADSPNASLLDNVIIQTWKSYRRPYIAAMEKEQTMLTAMFALVGVTTIFIILVVFYMVVAHKTKDIGVLKSIGVSDYDILSLFSIFSALIALTGSLVGSMAAVFFLNNINTIEKWTFEKFGFQLWDRTLYVGIDQIPNAVDYSLLATVVICAVVACLAGAFLPACHAAKLRPVQALQVGQI